jgi:hypothetical protein
MTLLNLLTIAACLVAGAFTVILGNRALQAQRIEKRRRRRKEMMVEGTVEQEAQKALLNLAHWRKRGYLSATEASWEQLPRLARKDPVAVLELQRIVEHNAKQTGDRTREGTPMVSVRIKLANEDTKEELKGNLGNGNERGSRPKDMVMVQAPLVAL